MASFNEKTGKATVAKTLPNSTPYMDGYIDPMLRYVWAAYPNGKGGGDIWQFENGETERAPAKWRILASAYPISTAGEDQMPSTTRDGAILTFVSDRPEGKGGLDIYEAVRVRAATAQK